MPDCCYLLVEWRSAADLARWVGGRIDGRARSESEAAAAAWPSLGSTAEGWTLLVDPRGEFAESNAAMRAWSAGGGRVVFLRVSEAARSSRAVLWADGAQIWEVSVEAGAARTAGRFPFDLEVLSGPQIPVEAVRIITNWRPHLPTDAEQPMCTELRYQRPAR